MPKGSLLGCLHRRGRSQAELDPRLYPRSDVRSWFGLTVTAAAQMPDVTAAEGTIFGPGVTAQNDPVWRFSLGASFTTDLDIFETVFNKYFNAPQLLRTLERPNERSAACATEFRCQFLVAGIQCHTDPKIENAPISISGVLLNDGTQYDAGGAGNGGPPAGSTALFFQATVTAAPGAWTLAVEAQGALGVSGAPGDGGQPAASQAFQTYAGGSPVTLSVPLTVTGTQGAGIVIASVGNVTQEFTFNLAPIPSVPITVCPAGEDGGCAADDGGAETASCASGTRTLAVANESAFQVGCRCSST